MTDKIDEPRGILKPSGFDLDKFRSKRPPAIAGVETLQSGLSALRLAEAKDFVRLHPNEETHWSPPLCFVSVPIKGQKRDTLHLITEDLALEFLSSGKIDRFRLALASKPHDVFFLCKVPTENLDNNYNADTLAACDAAKIHWVEVTSRRLENIDGYKVALARDPDAFPEPNWPRQSLGELIQASFKGCLIDKADHPAILRLIGARQTVS